MRRSFDTRWFASASIVALMLGRNATAESVGSAATEPARVEVAASPRSSATAPKRRPGEPSKRAHVTERARPAARATRAPPPRPVVKPAATAAVLLVQYQRVGRDLFTLQDRRGAAAVLDLMEQFRAIRIYEATATAESRAAVADELASIRDQAERRKLIEVDQACLDNPLTRSCQ